MDLRIKRSLAFGVDYLVIITYAGLLFLLSTALELGVYLDGKSQWVQQAVGFSTLTFPVFVYCTLSEYYWGYTLGKWVFKLRVIGRKKSSVVWRNLLKFLPWEMAHTAVYVMALEPEEPNGWIWFLAIFPQVLVGVYCLSMLHSKGIKTLYDCMAGTWIGPFNVHPRANKQTAP